MIVKFAVTNYRGFADRIEWDLSTPANYEFNKNAIKDGIGSRREWTIRSGQIAVINHIIRILIRDCHSGSLVQIASYSRYSIHVYYIPEFMPERKRGWLSSNIHLDLGTR